MRGAGFALAFLALAALPGAGCGDDVTAHFVPVVNVCGDGVEEGWEACDCGTDPALLPPGCLAINSDEPNQLCRTDCQPQRCGDGVTDDLFGEACDDGPDNSLTSGHCRPDCTLATCGDGVLDPGEDCDNGPDNSDAPDLGPCRTDCKALRCGDGIRDLTREEECDDGNSDDTDGCLSTCKIAFCGDGAVRASVEQCDDGLANSDAPDAHCRLDCTLQRCGDGVQDSDEECDTGAANSDTVPDACRTDCTLPRCGDSVKDTGEECDTGPDRSNATPDACRLDCKNPSCGDAVTDTGEGCDCGTDAGHLPAGCTKVNCVGEPGCTCSPTCKSALCGNGTIDSGEECDDGDGVNCDTPNCHCRTTCKLRYCGDGITDDLSGEECDTAAARSNTLADRCRLNCKNPWCGDNVIDTAHGEQCDDFAYWGMSCNQSNCQKQWGPMLVANTLSVNSDPDVGCDLNGDSTVDNWLGLLGSAFSSVLQTSIDDGTLIYLLELRRLNDPTGQNDADVDFARYSGNDYDNPPNPSNNYGGAGQFYIDPPSLDANGDPLSLFRSSVLAGGNITGQATVFTLPTGSLGTLELRLARLSAHIDTDGSKVTGVSQPGQICGAIPACVLDMMPNPVTAVPVDTLLELVLFIGVDSGFAYTPDIDLDGDGLESYNLDGSLKLVSCVDGDGTTTVPLHPDAGNPLLRCPCDPRFADAYSVTVNFTAVPATVMGVQAGATHPSDS
jgi:cysteine-rich repeat protein